MRFSGEGKGRAQHGRRLQQRPGRPHAFSSHVELNHENSPRPGHCLEQHQVIFKCDFLLKERGGRLNANVFGQQHSQSADGVHQRPRIPVYDIPMCKRSRGAVSGNRPGARGEIPRPLGRIAEPSNRNEGLEPPTPRLPIGRSLMLYPTLDERMQVKTDEVASIYLGVMSE